MGVTELNRCFFFNNFCRSKQHFLTRQFKIITISKDVFASGMSLHKFAFVLG